MGCACTCPKTGKHSDDHEKQAVQAQLQHQTTASSKKQLTNIEDEKQNQHLDITQNRQAAAYALFCKFGNVINEMIPFCIENLNHAINETVEIYNLNKDVDDTITNGI